MSTKFVGFIGIECYDVMLYAAKILRDFHHRVLLIDASTEQSLCSILPDGFDTAEIVSYKGIDLLTAYDIDLGSYSDFDYVYINFGWNTTVKAIQQCEEIYCFTDYQKHNYKRLKDVQLDKQTSRFLVIRNEVPAAYVDDVVEMLEHLNFNEQNVYGLSISQTDVLAMLRCQHDGTISFSNVSKDMQQLIKVVLEYDVEPKLIAKNWKSLSMS